MNNKLNCRLLCALLLMAVLVGTASAVTLQVNTTGANDGAMSVLNVRNDTWAHKHDGAGEYGISTNDGDLVQIRSDKLTNTWYAMSREALIFDTSPVPDTATITAATLSIYKDIGATDLGDMGVGIVGFTIDGTISADDYDNFGTTIYAPYINLSAMASNNHYYNFTFNGDGIGAISKTGNTGLGIRLQPDISNTAPTWISYARSYFQLRTNESGSTRWPYLIITYTLPDTTPPVSITGLTNQTITTCNGPINWNWTADADISGVEIF